MMEKNRIVLFPYGQSASARSRDACAALLIRSGIGLDRLHDGPWNSDPMCQQAESMFLRHVSRMFDIMNGGQPPLVILARTCPLPLIVLAKRRRLCEALPNLNRALWVIYVDAEENPFFDQNATALGDFDEPSLLPDGSRCPFRIWTPFVAQRSSKFESYAMRLESFIADDRFNEKLDLMLADLERIPIARGSQMAFRAVQFADESPSASRRHL